MDVLCVSNFYTPPKTNMEPEKDGFEKESPFPGSISRFHVSFRGSI